MTNIRRAAAAAGLLVLLIVAGSWRYQSVQAAPLNDSGCGGVISPEANAAFEQQVVELINQERAKAGLPPLKRVSQLDDSARYFARDMAVDDYWPDPSKGLVAHGTYDRSNGNLVYVCSWDQRIKSYFPNPSAENIAAGFSNPVDAVKGWMGSSGHKANILSSGNWETGVGYAAGGTWGLYWVEDFGNQPGVYPLVINGEAAVTTSTNVTLYVYGTWTEIRLKNDSGAWTDWRPFANNLSWQIGPGAGMHTVSVEMRTATSSASSSDTIYSNVPVPNVGPLNIRLFIPLIRR